jgi:hypothetical protein
MPDYTVLVSLDGGKTFAVYGGEEPKPVPASTRTTAAEQVRKSSPELVGNEEAVFLPLASFEPIRKRKQMVASWRWGPAVDDEQKQQELPDG